MESDKKKIIYVITKSNWGGAQRYVFDLASNLPKDRFDVIVAAGGSGHLIQKLHNAGIPVIPIPYLERDIKPLKEILSLWSLFKIFRSERPDVVHLNSSKIGGLGAVAARLAGVSKIVFTVHGWAFHENRPAWQHLLIVFLSRLAGRFQDSIVHISKSDLASTLFYKIAPFRKTTLIPLAIREEYRLARSAARDSLGRIIGQAIPQDAHLIGSIAELTKNKGLAHLLDALKQVKFQIPNSKLQTIIVGEGEEQERLQNQIRALGLEDTVRIAGFIPGAAQYLKAFDIFVLPSLKEGLPYTVLEALAAGTPVIASGVGGIPDVITDGVNGFTVPPAKPERLAEVILSLIHKYKPPLSTENKTTYTFSEMLEKTIALYESRA